MADPRDVLQEKWVEANRFANFGNALVGMHVQGFRGHVGTKVEFRSPITAFCGLNGTGKTTLLQLASAAYKIPDLTPYYYRNFFLVSALDPAPFTADARVAYEYWDEERKASQTTIARNPGAALKGWSGYKRRPFRHVMFIGVSAYVPRVERGDFLIYGAARVNVTGRHQTAPVIRDWVARILGRSLDGLDAVDVESGLRKGQILSMTRGGVSYAEPHMGFGEGRIGYLVDKMETIPAKSLVLLEEPETSLHPSAQHTLGHYLMDVSSRRGHQIIASTHSEYLLRGLPSMSRVCLHWDGANLRQLHGLTASQANSLMTHGRDKALTVLVEDDCARTLLSEMLRRSDPAFLAAIQIAPGGSHTAITTTMKCLKDSGLEVAAVLDGDRPARPGENIFTLPGGKPPEIAVVECPQVSEYLRASYGVIWNDLFAAEGFGARNHHDWIPSLANRLSVNVASLMRELCQVYAERIDCGATTRFLKEAITR